METRVLDKARMPIGPLAPRPLGDGVAVAPRPSRRRETVPNATLVARVDLTPHVARFFVQPDVAAPPFKPGQYFAVGLEVEGAVLQRPYSTATAAGATGQLEFLVKRVASGTFTPHLFDAAPGTRVWLGPPKGLFMLQAGDPRTHLFISTGTGLAPFISMTQALLGEPNAPAPAGAPRVVVVHGVSYQAELAYRDRLETWSAGGRLDYVPSVSRPSDPRNAGWTGETGRAEAILAGVCDRISADPAETVAYLCGNPDMIEASIAVLGGRGFADGSIVRENYWNAPVER
jgi:ferredoxin--NADP+ reductase